MSNRENEKPKFTTRVKSYFRGVKSELRKVNWPTKKELTNYTVVVLVTTLAMTLVIWGLDLVFENLVALIV
ncbi:preprotein translocase subunit SecE [Sedimentibacter sp. MB31-C6]|uniref:preprotein translocase subunit SecE n=1 Tax=Sedimentibacter sp. MB31-C6 TaxID=3109366 RepID=UPI002DDD371F|nr:preprotein translocase subunit SecE [Sedimentibacter sp. MB36-C1]WSI03842.1 preprotein translocase subunit SecE [Sedimentibacter sp. MB36-C1]